MKTKIWAIILMILVTFLTSSAQIFYKIGANKLEFRFISIITNYSLLIGIFLYMAGAILMITAFKGGELSVLYPIVATSYIWVGLLSYFIFNESLNVYRWIGIFSIFFGVVFVGMGSKDKEIAEDAGAAL
ncbi:EamA family transporter [Candidatus Woesearchaeota archaeon]|nr:EamA family transporter [Candidatus Woesearchaeota archaeon]